MFASRWSSRCFSTHVSELRLCNAAVQLVVAISPQARNAKKTSINVHTLLIYSCTFLWRRTVSTQAASLIIYGWWYGYS